MRYLFALLFILGGLTLSTETFAQSEPLGDEEIRSIKQHQMYLDKPAISIKNLRYEKDDQPIEGEISEDGRRIIMDGYVKKGRVTFTVFYADGTDDKMSIGSCFIDPVIPL